MRLKVPVAKAVSIGMRKLSEGDFVERALKVVQGKARVKRTMWSRRAQEYDAKINSGDLIAIAEVVRDLYRAENQPEQSYSERQLYEAALDRMAREIAAVNKMSKPRLFAWWKLTLPRAPSAARLSKKTILRTKPRNRRPLLLKPAFMAGFCCQSAGLIHKMRIFVPLRRCGRTRRMSRGCSATQPAVGSYPGLIICMKIAEPRLRLLELTFQSSTRQTS